MTLSRWFRDYLYIPLGGNRLGPEITYRNLFVVFFLCGLWHGAGYTFVFWLAAERVYVTHVGPLPNGAVAWARTFFIVTIGWVFFRSNSIEQALHFLSTMIGISSGTAVYYNLTWFLTPRNVFFILCGLGFALFPFERFSMRLDGSALRVNFKATIAAVIFFYAVAMLQVNSFNPFIYFRF